MGRQRLLVVTYHFGPDGPVGGLRWFGFTKYLARRGWTVTVVTGPRPFTADAPIPVRVERCPPFWTVLDGVRLLRRLVSRRPLGWSPNGSRPEHPPAPPGPLARLVWELAACLAFPDEGRGWMFRAALRTRALIRRFRPHVVVSSGPPHSAHLVTRMATLGLPVRWVMDFRDPWAGPLAKILDSDPRLGSKTFRTLRPHLERFVFRAADGAITTTRPLAEALRARYPDVPVVCIPNGVDPSYLPPPALDPYPGLSLAYAGWLYAGRDFGPVVRALRVFLERHPEAARAGPKLRIAGGASAGHARAFYDAVRSAGVEAYVEVLGSLPRDEALQLVSRSRLAVVLAQDQGAQIPAKLYESVAMGIPTLVLTESGSATGAEAARLGARVRDPADIEGIAAVLEELWRQDASPRSGRLPPITYEEITPRVDELLRDSLRGTRGTSR